MITIIAAMTRQGKVIGKKGKLPWNLPEELALFRKLTENSTVIMGRKTYEAIGQPLPERHNIILSRSKPFWSGVEVCPNIEEALRKAETYGKDIFIIGGREVFKACLPFADKMYLSFIKREYEGDTYFPEWKEEGWRIEREEEHTEFTLVVYERVTNKNSSKS